MALGGLKLGKTLLKTTLTQRMGRDVIKIENKYQCILFAVLAFAYANSRVDYVKYLWG